MDPITGADLVIGMSRQHVREIVLPSFPMSNSGREFVRRASTVVRRPVSQDMATWLRMVKMGRRYLDLIGDLRADNIADPSGGSATDYREMLREVDDLTGTLQLLAWV